MAAAVAGAAVAAAPSTPQQDIEYSDKYEDAHFEYRHVILPKEIAKKLPNPPRLLTEMEWRHIGVQQSRGWVHYEIHRPEPHILLFRRPLGTDPRTGKVTTNFNATAVAPAAANASIVPAIAVNAGPLRK